MQDHVNSFTNIMNIVLKNYDFLVWKLGLLFVINYIIGLYKIYSITPLTELSGSSLSYFRKPKGIRNGM